MDRLGIISRASHVKPLQILIIIGVANTVMIFLFSIGILFGKLKKGLLPFLVVSKILKPKKGQSIEDII